MIKENDLANKLLVKVYSTENEAMTSRFGIITLTDTLKETILSLSKELLDVKHRMTGKASVYTITAFNSACEYIDERDDFSGDLNQKMEGQTLDDLQKVLFHNSDNGIVNKDYARIEIPENVIIDFLRDDVGMLHISQFGFKFSCYIKHTDIRLDTETISFDIFDADK